MRNKDISKRVNSNFGHILDIIAEIGNLMINLNGGNSDK